MANEIIIGRQGNQKMPINDGSVSRQHCKVTDNGDGTYTIENISSTGITKVDGQEVIKTKASLNSRIQLGPTFNATLVELIGAPSATPKSNPSTTQSPSAKQQEVKTFRISHLQSVWDNYNDTNIEMAEQQRKINITRTGFGIFTMCAMPTIFFLGPVGYILTGIGVIGNLYSFVGMKNTESARERHARQDAFDEAWVCPNPDCKKTLPARNYRLLLKNHQSCPHCKCKYVE